MKHIKTFGFWALLLVASVFALGFLGVAAASPGGAIAFTWGVPIIGFTKLFNWDGLKKIKASEQKAAIIDAVAQAFRKVSTMPLTGKKMVGPDSSLYGIAPVVFDQVPFNPNDPLATIDRGFELLFRERDMRTATSPTFDILDIRTGIIFYQQLAGEEAKLTKIGRGAKQPVGFLRFTGGFTVLDDWLRFNEYYKIEELTIDTVLSWWDSKATLLYGLLIALSSDIDEDFDTDDATTINNACSDILAEMKDAGYKGISDSVKFVITCNPLIKARIMKALSASFINPNTNINQIVYNIGALVSTTYVPPVSYYVSFPGYKTIRGEWEDLNARPAQRNELYLGSDNVWTGAFNATIAEPLQHRRCALST
jgi:hypothetical protein